MQDVQKALRDNGILICFSGRLTQRLIAEYGEAVKTYLETENRPKNEVYDIFSLYIEQTQNINNYCAAKTNGPYGDTIAQSCIVTIGKTGEGSYVCSGNLVEEADVAPLRAYLDSFLHMDKDELKALYRTKLKQEPAEGQESAGLGLIAMARKSAKPLDYSFVRQPDGLSYFTLKAIV